MGLVYSTNPDVVTGDSPVVEISTPAPSAQKLIAAIDRKNRSGKQVTVIKGFIGRDEDLNSLAKTLKTRLGVGGSAKDGEILIQGDFRDKAVTILSSLGYVAKRGN